MILLKRMLDELERAGKRRIVAPPNFDYYSPCFDLLPLDCLTKIMSFTTVEEASICAMVSKIFKLAADSDTVWEKFLPEDYESLVPPSSRVFASKKELYLSLCDEPILMDDGTQRFWLEKKSGKRCFMLSAKNLAVSLPYDYRRVVWIPSPEEWFESVALLRLVGSFFDIRVRRNSTDPDLSPRTFYSVYIVFKKANYNASVEDAVRVTRQKVSRECLGFENGEIGIRSDYMEKPQVREDGWMEIEFARFFYRVGMNDKDKIFRRGLCFTPVVCGMIILGFEFRPAITVLE